MPMRDARHAQIAVLAALVAYGTIALDFVIEPWAIPAAIAGAVLAEGLVFRWRRAADRPRPPYESAIISALSTLLLFRSESALAYAAVAVFAVLSKLVFRVDGKHFVNPTNGAVLFGATFLPGWISSGQWGQDVVLIFVLAAGATITLSRAARIDTALAFLGGTVAVQLARHFVIGYSWASVQHAFSSGAFWLFALYMITDPRTTPAARWARIVHGAGVAALAGALAQFWWVRDAQLWSLLALSPAVPLLDLLARVRIPTGGLHEAPSPIPSR
jgi:Na+-translocating ferredoxin:NAD+ oxidoreductase RnfD subunit